MGSLNVSRRFRIIVESFSQLANGDFEDGVADESIRPDGVQELFFCDELTGTTDEVVENSESLGSNLDRFCAEPQAFVDCVQAKRLEDYAFIGGNCGQEITETLRNFYDSEATHGPFCSLDGRMAIQLSLCDPVTTGNRH